MKSSIKIVDWDGVAGADGYRCHIKQLLGEPNTSNNNELGVNSWKIDCGTTTKYTLTSNNVVGGYWYKFVVEAYSSTADSSWSKWVYTYVPQNRVLDRPIITSPIAAVDYNAGEDIVFTWGKVTNATNYTYYVKQLVGEPTYLDNEAAINSWSGTTGSANRYFTLEGKDVQENTWYKFVVRAEAEGYDVNWSKYTYIYIPEREDWIHMVLPDSMISIGEETFMDNVLLRTFDAGNTRLEEIENLAFANCTNLKSINLPDSVYFIADDAFENCPNMTIHCIVGSYAEQYAISKGIPVEAHGVALETEAIQLSQSKWNIGSLDAAEMVLRVNSSQKWSASSNASWLTLSASSGNDGANIVLKATRNTTKSPRSAVVTFTCGKATAIISVIQAASKKECSMEIGTDYWTPSNTELTREFIVKNEHDFSVTSNKSWLTCTVVDSSINASVSSSALNSSDVGVLTITCNECNVKRTITVAPLKQTVPAPATITVSSDEPHAVKISWSEVFGASYIIERSDNDRASWTKIATTSNTSYTDASNIGAAKTYYYRITACKTISGKTVKSNSVESGDCNTPAEAVLEFRGTIDSIGDNGRARIEEFTDVSWSTISDMTYKLSLKDITDSKNEYYVNGLKNKNVGATSSYSLSGLLVEGHKYRVWVGAFNSADRCEGQTKAREFSVINTSVSSRMSVSSDYINYLKIREGVHLTAYQDLAGVWTIGCGHTGSDVYQGLVISEARAEELLYQDLAEYEEIVNNFMDKNGVSLTQNQFDAVVSICYNAGEACLTNSAYKLRSTLLKYKVGSNIPIDEAFRMFGGVHHSNKTCIPGLFYRRCEEGAMFYAGVYQVKYNWNRNYSWWGKTNCSSLMPDNWYPTEYGYVEPVIQKNIVVIRQDDYADPINDLYYEKGKTISSSGCALCAIVNSIHYLTGDAPDVHDVAEYAMKNNQYTPGEGTNATIYESYASAYGAEYGIRYVTRTTSYTTLKGYLDRGCVAIVGVKRSGSNGGHIIAIADYDPLTDKYLILDSAGDYTNWTKSMTGSLLYAWQSISSTGTFELNPNCYIPSGNGFRIYGLYGSNYE